MTENVSPEMVERMIALVKSMASTSPHHVPRVFEVGPAFDEARAIAAELPAPVDLDLLEAREIVAEAFREYSSDHCDDSAQLVLAGRHDDSVAVQRAVAALRTRTLATQGDS